MRTDQGIFIAIEGVDGSGKGTQFKLLAERLKAVGYDVETFDFPRYEEPSSHFVRRYLNGEYGPASEISPYSAALFYALDRFEAAPAIRKALEAGKIVLSNRYTGSSMAHQGSKFGSEAEQRGFFIWVESLEYQLLNIPRPDVSIFLRVPPEVSFKLIENKTKRNYTDKKRDEHEADFEHLRRSVQAYDTLCKLFPKDFLAIECSDGDKILPIPAINNMIWQTIRYFLPTKRPHRARGTIVKLDSDGAAASPEKLDDKTKKLISGAYETAVAELSLLALIELAQYGVTPANEISVPGLSDSRNYFTPAGLDGKTQKRYHGAVDELLNKRQALRKKLAAKSKPADGTILAAITPMAIKTAADIPVDKIALAAASTKLTEIKKLGQPQAKTPKKNQALNKLEVLLQERMNPNQSTSLEPLSLLEIWPRNEFEILGSGLYGLSDLPRQEVQAELENWTYEQKYQALSEFLSQIEPPWAKQVRYSWDVIGPQSLLIELCASGLPQNLQVQAATPRYGYSMPETLEESSLSDDFIECFDLSLKFYSELQSAGHDELASYVTLAGHRARFQFGCDLDGLAKLVAGSPSKEVKQFLETMISRLEEDQPIVAEYLRGRSKRPKTGLPSKANKSKRKRSNK